MNVDNARSRWSTQKNPLRKWIATLLCGAAVLGWANWAGADPPSRVARLGYISGAVSFSPAGDDNWVEAVVNRPLITGDRLWVDSGARAELQIGSAVFYLDASTSVNLLNLDNQVVQLEVAQGTVNAKVRRLGAKDVVEIDTPNLANSIRRPGSYRIEVDPTGDSTAVITRNGQAEVYGDGASYLVNAGQSYRFYGTGLRDYDNLETPRADEFDNWTDTRYRRSDRSASARYVSRDVIGYEDLDENGTWRSTPDYGNVWYPNHVARDWAPYRDGHWSWVEPWGWTWVDDAPWGFAVSHYGRWANTGGNWGWVPGPQTAQPVYAPALVAFIAGAVVGAAISNSNAGNVGWFPLGPRDVYRPSYPVSRTYFTNVNTSNTRVNNTTVINVYNNKRVTNVTYVNQRVPGAVVAVPAAAFAQSRPVGKSRVEMSRDAAAKARVTPVAAVTPVQASVQGGASAGRRPPSAARARPVVAKERPPAAPVPFAARERGLAAQPGRPLDAKALAAVKPAAPAPAAEVKVIAPPKKPAAAPPPKQAVARDATRRSPEQRGPQFDGKGRPPEAQKGALPAESQKGAPFDGKKGAEAPKGAPPPEAQKGPAFDGKKGSASPGAPKGQPPEVQKGRPPFDGKKGPPSPEAPKAPPPSEPQKASQPPEAQKGSPFERTDRRPPEAQKGRQPPVTAPPPVSVPRPPEAQKAPPPPVNVPRPPETPKGPPPEAQKAPAAAPDNSRRKDERRGPPEERKSPPPVNAPRPPEPPKAPPPEAQKAPPPVSAPRPPEERRAPPVNAPRPPEVQKAPPPVSAPRPPEERRAPPPPVNVQRPPEPPKAPPPPPPPVAPKPAPPPPPVAPPPPPPPKPAPPPPPPKPAPPPPPPPAAPKPPPAPPAAPPAPAPKPEAAKAPDKGEKKKDEKKE